MGEFIIEGEEALHLVQWLTSNDASKLSPGKIQYSCFPNEKGGIVDDLLVYQLELNKYMFVVNASNIEKDWKWIMRHKHFNARCFNVSEALSLLALQGPDAIKTLQKITKTDLTEIPYYTFKVGSLLDVDDIIISATGYTGEDGFELYIPNTQVVKIWNALLQAGEEFGIKPIGLGARDTLRLEMGYCLYGNDIDDFSSPVEAGLGWITKFDKPFINCQNLLKQKESGPAIKLVGFEMIEKGIPRHGYNIVDSKGTPIGIVTSGTQSPTLQKGIGMGYVYHLSSNLDDEIFIQIRDNVFPAKIAKFPFVK